MASRGSAFSTPFRTHLRQLLLVLRQPGALEIQRDNLPLQLPHRPVSADAFDLVKGALERVFDADELLQVREGECLKKLFGWDGELCGH